MRSYSDLADIPNKNKSQNIIITSDIKDLCTSSSEFAKGNPRKRLTKFPANFHYLSRKYHAYICSFVICQLHFDLFLVPMLYIADLIISLPQEVVDNVLSCNTGDRGQNGNNLSRECC